MSIRYVSWAPLHCLQVYETAWQGGGVTHACTRGEGMGSQKDKGLAELSWNSSPDLTLHLALF